MGEKMEVVGLFECCGGGVGWGMMSSGGRLGRLWLYISTRYSMGIGWRKLEHYRSYHVCFYKKGSMRKVCCGMVVWVGEKGDVSSKKEGSGGGAGFGEWQ